MMNGIPDHNPDDPRTVLLIGDTISPHMVRLAAALSRRTANVLVLNGHDLVERVRAEHGVDVTNVPYTEVRLRGNARIPGISLIERRLNYRRLRRMLARYCVDVIHLNNLYCGDHLERFAWIDRLDVPMVVTAWGTDVDDSAVPKHPSYPPLRKTLLAKAALITGDSEPMLRRCRTFVPHRTSEDFRLVRWHPDEDWFNPAVAREGRRIWRERLGIADDECVFLSHRHARDNYRVDRIIRAFERVLPDRPSWLIVKSMHSAHAAQEEYMRKLRRLAEPLGDRVRFVGQIPGNEVPGFFGVADVAIGIPAADGAPATIPELMALGIPLIVSDLEDYRGLVDAGRNAYVVDATRDESVAEAMMKLACDAPLRDRLRNAGLASATKHNGLRGTVDDFAACYQEAMRRRSRPARCGLRPQPQVNAA